MEKNKIIFVFTIFIFSFLLVLSKAFYVQVLNNRELVEYSKKQTLKTSVVYPYRGNVYDRKGSPLALNIQTYSIFTIPKNVKDGVSAYKELSKIVPRLSLTYIKKKILNRQNYTWLARKISLTDEQIKKIKELEKNSGGIYIEAVPKRVYPNGELLSQALGFVGIDNIGLSGIEYFFNEKLKGEPRITKYFRDAKGRAIKFESNEIIGDNHDITLTIDKELQAFAERSLKNTVLQHSATRGGVGVLDVSTGEVLAIANYPSYDLNSTNNIDPNLRKLSYISDPFEPGSVFKTLTIASALENNIARPTSKFYCEKGSFKVDDHIISEAEVHEKFEWLTVSEILQNSSNIGTTKIAFDLRFPKLKETLQKFNIGEKTGIEVAGESRGIFPNQKNVSALTLSNVSFGQGIATTAIQILAAYGAIANDGIYISPTLIKGSDVIKRSRRVIKKEVAEDLQKMLVQAVEKGTGTNAKISNFIIAGKTGTAQRPSSNGGYSGHVPDFVGFPLNIKKRFCIFVYVDNPGGSIYYGNLVAAPLFREVAQYLLYKSDEYQGIIATKNSMHGSKNEPQSVLSTLKKSTGSKKEMLFVDNAVNNELEEGSSYEDELKKRDYGENLIPNFIGLDKKTATIMAQDKKINLNHRGMGLVVAQNPLPGSQMTTDTVVELIYSPPKYE